MSVPLCSVRAGHLPPPQNEIRAAIVEHASPPIARVPWAESVA